MVTNKRVKRAPWGARNGAAFITKLELSWEKLDELKEYLTEAEFAAGMKKRYDYLNSRE